MASLWRVNEAAARIEAGDVIACPAEAVWGLSCDPWNLSAVAFLCEMKQRALSKGVIVASGDVAHFAPLLDALDDDERQRILDKLTAEKTQAKINITRFKGLGEMNPSQLRESTISKDSRRLVQLTVDAGDNTYKIMDMLLGKKTIQQRKAWLEKKGDLAQT